MNEIVWSAKARLWPPTRPNSLRLREPAFSDADESALPSQDLVVLCQLVLKGC